MLVYEDFKVLEDQELVPRWCMNHFDIDPDTFANHIFWQRENGQGVWVTGPGFTKLVHPAIAALGMLVMRQMPPKGKPTSVFLQRFGHSAKRNVYTLSDADVDKFLRRESIPITAHDDKKGYALVRTKSQILGCGRIQGSLLISEIPKHWLAELGV